MASTVCLCGSVSSRGRLDGLGDRKGLARPKRLGGDCVRITTDAASFRGRDGRRLIAFKIRLSATGWAGISVSLAVCLSLHRAFARRSAFWGRGGHTATIFVFPSPA